MKGWRYGALALLIGTLGCDFALDELPESVDVGFEMSADRYSPATTRFSPLSPPRAPRNLFHVTDVPGGLLVLGGIDEDGRYLREVEAYDVASDRWSPRAPWPDPGLAWVLRVGELVCTVGGYEDIDEPLRTVVDCYDPVADTWSSRARIPAPYSSIYPVVHEGRIYVLGGTRVEPGNPVSPVDWARVYDPESDTWTELAPLPAARGLMAAESVGGRIYLVGGYDEANFDDHEGDAPEEREMLVYDPAADSWDLAPQMPSARALFGTDVVADRLVVFFGITDGPLVEVFDPASGTWEPHADPTEPIADGVYTYVQHQGQMMFLVLADSLDGSGTSSSGKLWTHDVVADRWEQPARRSSDDGETPLMLGRSVGDDVYFVGSLTEVEVEQHRGSPLAVRRGVARRLTAAP